PTSGTCSTPGAAAARCTRSASPSRRRSTIRRSSATSIACCAASSSSSRRAVRLTRRQALAGAATGALGAAGVYELVDRLAGPSERRRAAEAHPAARAEQHVLGGVDVIVDNGVEVVVPPLHHEVVTARVTAATSPKALREAQAELEHV